MYMYLIDVQQQWLDIVNHDEVRTRIRDLYRPIHLEYWPSTGYHREVYLLMYGSDQNIVDIILSSPVTMTRLTPNSLLVAMAQWQLSHKFPQSLIARVEDPASEWFKFNLENIGSEIDPLTGPLTP